MSSAKAGQGESLESEGAPNAWQKVEGQFSGSVCQTMKLSSSSPDMMASKRSSEFFDPCQDFAKKSIKCLRRNGGDKEMCTDYFQ